MKNLKHLLFALILIIISSHFTGCYNQNSITGPGNLFIIESSITSIDSSNQIQVVFTESYDEINDGDVAIVTFKHIEDSNGNRVEDLKINDKVRIGFEKYDYKNGVYSIKAYRVEKIG